MWKWVQSFFAKQQLTQDELEQLIAEAQGVIVIGVAEVPRPNWQGKLVDFTALSTQQDFLESVRVQLKQKTPLSIVWQEAKLDGKEARRALQTISAQHRFLFTAHNAEDLKSVFRYCNIDLLIVENGQRLPESCANYTFAGEVTLNGMDCQVFK